MNRVFALVTLSSLLLLLSGTVIARENPGQYWETVMKNQPMPEEIKILVVAAESQNEDKFVNNDHGYGGADESKDKSSIISSSRASSNPFVKDFDSSPAGNFYYAQYKPGDEDQPHSNHFVKDFDSSPAGNFYYTHYQPGDQDQPHSNHFVKDFDSSPAGNFYYAQYKPGDQDQPHSN